MVFLFDFNIEIEEFFLYRLDTALSFPSASIFFPYNDTRESYHKEAFQITVM